MRLSRPEERVVHLDGDFDDDVQAEREVIGDNDYGGTLTCWAGDAKDGAQRRMYRKTCEAQNRE